MDVCRSQKNRSLHGLLVQNVMFVGDFVPLCHLHHELKLNMMTRLGKCHLARKPIFAPRLILAEHRLEDPLSAPRQLLGARP